MGKEKKPNPHAGHRKRMREDFSQNGFTAWQPHRVLEYLLFYTIPVADTNETAHNLINTCGSFAGVFAADKDMLMSVDGVGDKTADFLIEMGAFISYYNKTRFKSDAVKLTSGNCREYLFNLFDGVDYECLYIIFLDKQRRIKGEECIAEGSFNAVQIDNARLVRHAIKRGAAEVLIAHNHPSGLELPSKADIKTTQLIENALGVHFIKLTDHVIVSDNSCLSMRSLGYLKG